MINFIHSYIPHPVAFYIGSFSVRWYGLILAIALITGYFLSKKLARLAELSAEEVSSIYVNLALWGLVGARVYHVLNEFNFYWQNPGQILAVWNGGLAIHGAIIAGLAYLIYIARRHHPYTPPQRGGESLGEAPPPFQGGGRGWFWRLADLFVIPLILGQALGRWGNYFNQELFGRPTGLPWGIPIAPENRPAGYDAFTFFHPTFLYESIWNFFVLAILLLIYKRNNNKSPLPEGGLRGEGAIFWLYLLLYSLGRIGVELLRIDDVPMILGIRLPLLFSLALFLAAAVFLSRLYFSKSSPS